MCEICSKLTMKTPEQLQKRSNVSVVNFEHISQLFLLFLLLASVSVVVFEQVNFGDLGNTSKRSGKKLIFHLFQIGFVKIWKNAILP